jgi:hypothetical protein
LLGVTLGATEVLSWAAPPAGASLLPLNLADVRYFLQGLLPQLVLDSPAVLGCLTSQHQRKAAADRCHRTPVLAQLAHPGS